MENKQPVEFQNSNSVLKIQTFYIDGKNSKAVHYMIG